MPGFVMVDAAVRVTSTDHGTSANGTYTFGTAASDRIIVLGVSYIAGVGNAISAITIGGISATRIVKVNFVGADTSEIWAAAVPTGTTGNITVTASAITAVGISVYAMTGASSSAAFNTATSTGSGVSLSLNVPASGAAVGIATAVTAGATTFAWTGLTEDTDFSPAGSVESSAASGNFAAAQTTLTVKATPTPGASSQGTVAASWGP